MDLFRVTPFRLVAGTTAGAVLAKERRREEHGGMCAHLPLINTTIPTFLEVANERSPMDLV